MIRIIIVAPILAVRAGLRSLLDTDPDLEVTWEAATLAEIDTLPSETDVLLLSGVPIENLDFEVLTSEQAGRLALLVLTDKPQEALNLLRLPLRAWGVLSLDVTAEELIAAVRALNEGLLVGTPALLEPVLPQRLVTDRRDVEPLSESLTERETQVLQLLAQGLANKQIAVTLGISEHTVKFHVSSIYTKFGVASRTEAVRFGVQRGLVLM